MFANKGPVHSLKRCILIEKIEFRQQTIQLKAYPILILDSGLIYKTFINFLSGCLGEGVEVAHFPESDRNLV